MGMFLSCWLGCGWRMWMCNWLYEVIVFGRMMFVIVSVIG